MVQKRWVCSKYVVVTCADAGAGPGPGAGAGADAGAGAGAGARFLVSSWFPYATKKLSS